ncbi:MAG: ferrochelatase [Methylococcales symbiont of Hymedesmia sp. n. MRB-2018]|nr:MAG: ferrochelatase [Methylococcales symbiont of Hymedesmia sp. n. MRB-2018]
MATETTKKGVLIVNLGSPSAPTISAVRRYLKEFLWDPRVVNLPRFIWWIILHFLVLPFRPRKSLRAYKKIWQKQGSPLTFLTQQLVDKVAKQFDNSRYTIDCVMRYGKPSITAKLEQYKKNKIEEIIVIPLYPQYSSTTTASVYDAVVAQLMQWRYIPSLRFVSDYHQHPLYIEAIAHSIEQSRVKNGNNALLLMSFHGLPEQLTKWGEPYFHQCHRTAELIAAKLLLASDQWKIVFQSRFGKAKWLQPYCIEVLQALPRQGIKKVDVVCPGFAVDCLETLEEIEIANREYFIAAGGETYHYIAALNDSASHVKAIVALITENTYETL